MRFLSLEQQLIERLSQRVEFNGRAVDIKSARQVKRGADGEVALRVPAVLVTYDNYSVPESSGKKVRIGQSWTVTAVVENLRDNDGIGAREDGSVIVDQLVEQLQGWTPPEANGMAWTALTLTAPTFEPEYGVRNTYIPLTFTTERALRGKP